MSIMPSRQYIMSVMPLGREIYRFYAFWAKSYVNMLLDGKWWDIIYVLMTRINTYQLTNKSCRGLKVITRCKRLRND